MSSRARGISLSSGRDILMTTLAVIATPAMGVTGGGTEMAFTAGAGTGTDIGGLVPGVGAISAVPRLRGLVRKAGGQSSAAGSSRGFLPSRPLLAFSLLLTRPAPAKK